MKVLKKNPKSWSIIQNQYWNSREISRHLQIKFHRHLWLKTSSKKMFTHSAVDCRSIVVYGTTHWNSESCRFKNLWSDHRVLWKVEMAWSLNSMLTGSCLFYKDIPNTSLHLSTPCCEVLLRVKHVIVQVPFMLYPRYIARFCQSCPIKRQKLMASL